MKTLKDFQFKNKKVLLRVDFNVPLNEKGEILDDFRIEKALPTIKHLIEEKAKVIILSHLGRSLKNQKSTFVPSSGRGNVKNQGYGLKIVSQHLEKLLKQKVKFLDDCLGKRVEKEVKEIKEGEIVLLENLRFYPEEEKGDSRFAKRLAKLADIFINDAFGACHRKHASIVGVPKYLPSGAGLLLEKEIQVLSRVLRQPWHPLVVIIGGVKVETKIGAIESFLKKADNFLLGGEIANILLRVKGICVGKP